MQDLILLVEKEINLRDEYSAIEMLKSSGMEHDKACTLVETVMLYKENYFSRISKLKRLVIKILLGHAGKEPKIIFELLCNYLVSSGHYKSFETINQKIIEVKESLAKFELEFGYRDNLYYYSSEFKRKIIILVNLHFSDFPKSIQKNVMDTIGKEQMEISIDQRTQYITQKLQRLGK